MKLVELVQSCRLLKEVKLIWIALSQVSFLYSLPLRKTTVGLSVEGLLSISMYLNRNPRPRRNSYSKT